LFRKPQKLTQRFTKFFYHIRHISLEL
jgi:hypothetical protein